MRPIKGGLKWLSLGWLKVAYSGLMCLNVAQSGLNMIYSVPKRALDYDTYVLAQRTPQGFWVAGFWGFLPPSCSHSPSSALALGAGLSLSLSLSPPCSLCPGRPSPSSSSLSSFSCMQEFLASMCHQPVLTASLPFAHTARRSYRLSVSVNFSNCNSFRSWMQSWEV